MKCVLNCLVGTSGWRAVSTSSRCERHSSGGLAAGSHLTDVGEEVVAAVVGPSLVPWGTETPSASSPP